MPQPLPTPQEKARQLVISLATIDADGNIALFICEEVINSYSTSLQEGKIDFLTSPNPIEYWTEVQEEVKKHT